MIEIVITDQQLKQVQKDFERAGKQIEQLIVNAVNSTALAVESKAKQRTPVDTGRLRAGNKAVLYRGN